MTAAPVREEGHRREVAAGGGEEVLDGVGRGRVGAMGWHGRAPPCLNICGSGGNSEDGGEAGGATLTGRELRERKGRCGP